MAEFLNQLLPNLMEKPELLWQSFLETIQMVSIAGSVAFVIGLALGVMLIATRPGGVMANRWVYFIVGKIIDLFRSIPFILLVIMLRDFTRSVMGTYIGVRGAILPLLFGTVPFFARQVETAMAEVPDGLVEAAQSMGCSPWEILWRVSLRESVPGIVRGTTITLVSLIGFTAMAGAVGAGGLGNFAISYGGNRLQMDIAYVVVLVVLIMVSLIQAIGSSIARKATH